MDLQRISGVTMCILSITEMCVLDVASANWTASQHGDIEFTKNSTENSSLSPAGGDLEVGDYDYYNVSDRARSLLSKPHRILALILIFIILCFNLGSLAAIYHTRGRLTAHFRLLISLSVSDIFVAVSALLHIVNKVTNPAFRAGYGPYDERLKSRCGFMIIKALNTVGLNITLLNLMGMAIDHYIAILRPLHHTSLMDGKRTSVMIVTLWVVAILCGFSDFLSPVWEYNNYLRWRHKFNYCEFVWLTKYQEEYTVFAIALTCFVMMLCMYSRIYMRVQKHQRGRENSNQASHRSKKTLVTTLLILGTFMLCWLPMCVFNVSLIIISRLNIQTMSETVISFLVMAEHYLFDLLLLNGICDPIIYAVRIRDIQMGYRSLISKCCSRFCHSQYYQSANTSVRETNGMALSTMLDDSFPKGQGLCQLRASPYSRNSRTQAEEKELYA